MKASEMRRLLDVNILVAICDEAHPHHAVSARLFADSGDAGWASCPLTENGLMRILTNRAYLGGPRRPEYVIEMFSRLKMLNHRFVPDDLSLTEASRFVYTRFQSSAQVTDLYLLALAVKHRMRFSTLDARIDAGLVRGGDKALEIIAAR